MGFRSSSTNGGGVSLGSGNVGSGLFFISPASYTREWGITGYSKNIDKIILLQKNLRKSSAHLPFKKILTSVFEE